MFGGIIAWGVTHYRGDAIAHWRIVRLDPSIVARQSFTRCSRAPQSLHGRGTLAVHQSTAHTLLARAQMYLLMGGMAFVVGISVLLWLPDSLATATFLTEREKVVAFERVRDRSRSPSSAALHRMVQSCFTTASSTTDSPICAAAAAARSSSRLFLPTAHASSMPGHRRPLAAPAAPTPASAQQVQQAVGGAQA